MPPPKARIAPEATVNLPEPVPPPVRLKVPLFASTTPVEALLKMAPMAVPLAPTPPDLRNVPRFVTEEAPPWLTRYDPSKLLSRTALPAMLSTAPWPLLMLPALQMVLPEFRFSV